MATRSLLKRLNKAWALILPTLVTPHVVTVESLDESAVRRAMRAHGRAHPECRAVIVAPPMAPSIEAWARLAQAWQARP